MMGYDEGRDRAFQTLQAEIKQGGKFVTYKYVISILILTFRRDSKVHYIKPGESRIVPGIKYTVLSFIFGWWGFPFGLIFTPYAIVVNFMGGKDVTADVLPRLAAGYSPVDID